MNMVLERQLAVPAEIKERCPLTMKMSDTIGRKRTEIKEVFEGRDNRKLLIIGPCSADNEDSVIDYIGRLARIQEKVEEKILIVPRIYTNKPRTTGEGY